MSDYVTKAEAWDALAQVPPKTAKELEWLRPMADTARNVALFCGRHAPNDTATVDVPVVYINELRAMFGMDEYQ